MNVLFLFAVLVSRSTRLRIWGNEGGVILQPYADHVMLSSSQLYYPLRSSFIEESPKTPKTGLMPL